MKYGLENQTIPNTYEPGTFTNWHNRDRINTRPVIHLPARLGNLAQILAWKVDVNKLGKIYGLIPFLTIKSSLN